jgi:hypothetical protein
VLTSFSPAPKRGTVAHSPFCPCDFYIYRSIKTPLFFCVRFLKRMGFWSLFLLLIIFLQALHWLKSSWAPRCMPNFLLFSAWQVGLLFLFLYVGPTNFLLISWSSTRLSLPFLLSFAFVFHFLHFIFSSNLTYTRMQEHPCST